MRLIDGWRAWARNSGGVAASAGRVMALAVVAAVVACPASGADPGGAAISDGLKAVAGGAGVRVVWLEDANDVAPDPFGDAATYRLAGRDSGEAAGRRLLELRGNWSRPLFSPDGGTVVFTDRGRTVRDRKEHFDPVMMALDWAGGAPRRIGKGHAVDVRRDAATGVDWVYFIEDVVGGQGFTLSGNTLGRFPLAAPEQREVVWNRASMAVDNLQLSRDGTKFIGLFPGREAALVDVPSGRWHKLETGCWPSLAPDDSYVAWVFDGPHRHVRMFDVGGGREWKINLAAAPEVGGAETFHPRWSNDPRVIAFTGPYAVPKTGSRSEGNQVRLGARAAEIIVARLSPARDRLERQVRVTYNTLGDFFPDVWVPGGDDAPADGFAQQPALAFARGAPRAAAEGADTAVFRWRGQKQDNLVPAAIPPDGERACLAEARGIGRLSPHHGLWLDGGWFEADAVSAAALARGVRAARAITLAFTVTEWAEAAPEAQAVLAAAGRGGEKPFFAVLRRAGRFEGLLVPPENADPLSLGGVDRPLTPGRAVAVALTIGAGRVQWYVNGEPASEPVAVPEDALATWPEDAHLFFGAATPPGGGWRGNLEEIVLHPAALDAPAIRAIAIEAARATAARAWPVPVTARARLVSATTPDLDKLDTYRRMLVDHVYEVVRSSGALPKRISVLHWAVLDGASVPGLPREVAREYDLTLDPYDSRPELGSELTDITSEDFALPLFLDAATPPAPERDP